MASTSGQRPPNCSSFSARHSANTSSEKVRRLIEKRAGEIQHKRPAHHGHFDDPEVVVIAQELWDVALANCLYRILLEP